MRLLSIPTKPMAPPVSPLRWSVDAERSINQEWASVDDPGVNGGIGTTTDQITLPTSRISQDATVFASGSKSYKIDMAVGDVDYYNPTSAQRTELGMGNPTRNDMLDRLFNTGDERWIGWQMRLDPSFNVSPPSWNAVMQLKQLGSFGSPVWAFGVRDGQWRIDRTSNDPNDQWPASLNPTFFYIGSAIKGQWVKFLLHQRFHYDPAVGFSEMWGDLADGQGYRSLFAKTYQSTQKLGDGTGGYAVGHPIPVHLRVGIYQDQANAGATSLRYDNIAVAVSRSVAEMKAGIA